MHCVCVCVCVCVVNDQVVLVVVVVVIAAATAGWPVGWLAGNIVNTVSVKDLIQISRKISENLLHQCDCGTLCLCL